MKIDLRHSSQFVYGSEILFVFTMYLFIFFAFITIGPNNFADYRAYENYRFLEEGVSFEYITRSILAYRAKSSIGFNAADYLIFFCYAWSAVFFFYSARRDASQLHGFVVFSMFFFPFILTTGLRVSPLYPLCYVLVSEFNKGRMSFIKAMSLFFSSIFLFHDSAFIVLAIIIFSLPLILVRQFAKIIMTGAMLLSAVFIFLGSTEEFSVQNVLIVSMYLGERSNYLGASISNNSLSLLYFIAAWCVTLLALRDNYMRVELRVFSCLLMLFISICFVISSIAAMRFSHYLFIMLFAGRSCMLFSIERDNSFKLVFNVLYLPIFFAQLSQVIR